jgi:hypothetical protein
MTRREGSESKLGCFDFLSQYAENNENDAQNHGSTDPTKPFCAIIYRSSTDQRLRKCAPEPGPISQN